MARQSGVGTDVLAEVWAEAEAELAGEAPSAATEGESVETDRGSEGQPTDVEPDEEEDVGLLDSLEETLDDGDVLEQPEGDSDTYVVKGQSVSLQELKDGYMRQDDYTKKTQELAEARKRLENAEALYNAIDERPVETIRRLAQQFNMGQPLLQGQKQAPKQNQDVETLVQQKVQELLGQDPRLQQVEAQRAQEQVDAVFSSIEEDYGVTLNDRDRQRVLERADELGVQDEEGLRLVFGGLLQEAQRRKALRDSVKKTASTRNQRGEALDEKLKPIRESENDSNFWVKAREAARELGMEELL